jgi:hypothetical protein
MMKAWQTLLREGDPVRREPALTTDRVDRMRRAVLAAEPQPRTTSWPMRLTVASALGLLAAAGGWLHQASSDDRPLPPPRTSDRSGTAAVDSGERRQLQFSTPGGTRVIWVFNSDFDKR